ncbi:MAG TPA: hypothetical protein VHV30_12840 [Polyangiaceae bacterium]|jgi:hypothetical protein|nr:hypothetical protein [Polyangiaceae bacterium]
MRAASVLASLSLVTLVASVAASMGACTTKEPQSSTYFDTVIAPSLQTSCVHANTGAGCHVTDTKGNALGNLDLSSFTGVDHRRDLLLEYGPYQQPSLLLKNIPPYQLNLSLWDGTKIVVTTDIKHTAGDVLDPTATAFVTLKRWIDNGATVNNTGVPPVDIARSACSPDVPALAGFDPNTDPPGADFAQFKTSVNGVLANNCAAGNCHGTSVNALYLTCGATPQQIRWNYQAAVNYLAATPEQSEMLRRPLATSQGGSYHEGGPLFTSVNDLNYQAIEKWAEAHGPLAATGLDPAFTFFAQKVQPIFVKKGCMMSQCHSAGMFHDFRLRGGSAGSFSLTATRKNYELALAQMSFESDDVTASRLVRKNLYRPDQFPTSGGVFHRGGPLLEDFGSTNAVDAGPVCDAAKYDYDTAPVDSIPAFCVIRQWYAIERMERNMAAVSAVVYVSRPPPASADRPQDFDLFAGGASLHIAGATVTGGDVSVTGGDQAVDLSACGLGSGPDVRRPTVSWDGKTIAFAGRATASDPLAVYTVSADGTGCAKQADIANHPAMGGGLPEHDFDPVFSPPDAGGVESIVFASTRGNLDTSSNTFDYSGPQRTPEDPTKPNANLYVLEADPNAAGAKRVRQLTWQLDMERLPNFMQDGRLVFTAEKREPGFYQLALRRQNLDGGDYHPLFAQRGSIGYAQATYVTELADKNFAAIFSNADAKHGAGALGVFNRSIGVDFQSSSAKDYLVDPSVITPASSSSPETDFFKHSLGIVATDGSYTSPATLPGGKMLVSFGAGAPASFGGDYDVYVLDPATGTKTKLLGSAGSAEVEAVAVYPRTNKGIFASTYDEPNGHTSVSPTLSPTMSAPADVTVLDMTVLSSLLFQNTPTGRNVEPDLKSFEVYEDLPPDVTAFGACGGNTACDDFGKVYVRRRLLGNVPLLPDGSAHFRIPGGLPIVLHLGDDSESQKMNLPRWQREEMTFVPGETVNQSFQSTFFNNLCAGCHGSISGRPLEAALNPDFITEASQVAAASTPASDYSGPPSKRGSIIGPPATP